MDRKSERHLNETLDRLTKEVERFNSLPFAILKGLAYGVGTVVGATLFGGLILSILFRTFDSLEEVPVLKQLTEGSSFVEEVEKSQELRESFE